MVKRLFDILVVLCSLWFLIPLMLFAAIGIKLSDPGPVFFRAKRAGVGGKAFTMFKFRTMRVVQDSASVITANVDNRIFPFGSLLRKLKIDEIPQLINVLLGDMSLVGPRPEDMKIVTHHYSEEHMRTLDVLPGLTSPGALYGSVHEEFIGNDDPEGDYLEKMLPIKLALELVYAKRQSLIYDLSIMWRTGMMVFAKARGQEQFPDPPEFEEALTLKFPARRN